MSEFDLTEDLPPDERPDEEEYHAGEREAVSDDTGTVYEDGGEPLVTQHDLSLESEDSEE